MEPGCGALREQYLADHKIETFLIIPPKVNFFKLETNAQNDVSNVNSFIKKSVLLDIPKSVPNNLSVNKIYISQPDEDIARTPLTPEAIDRSPDEKPNRNQLTPTITEENEINEQFSNNKSSLSLPVEPPPRGPLERDRRKLSVQGNCIFNKKDVSTVKLYKLYRAIPYELKSFNKGLMAFAERRRSSSTISDIRKMSISNGEGISIRSPSGTCKFKL